MQSRIAIKQTRIEWAATPALRLHDLPATQMETGKEAKPERGGWGATLSNSVFPQAFTSSTLAMYSVLGVSTRLAEIDVGGGFAGSAQRRPDEI